MTDSFTADLTLPPATADIPGEAVECKDNHMTVYIPRAIIGGTDGSELYFIDKSCTGTNHNSTHVRIDTELSECKTVMEVSGCFVLFCLFVCLFGFLFVCLFVLASLKLAFLSKANCRLTCLISSFPPQEVYRKLEHISTVVILCFWCMLKQKTKNVTNI